MKNFYKVLLTVFLLSPLISSAQSNYKPGYVVTLKGDTLRGFINYRNWDGNPTAIKFKVSPKSNIQKLSVHDINFFSVTNKAEYRRYAGPISRDPTNMEKIIYERDTSFRMDTVFLELLQKGKNIALYAYTDDLKTRFYVGENPDYTPNELVYRLYHDVSVSTTGGTVNENTYMRQLLALAAKYNALSDTMPVDIENSGYREQYLIEIAQAINGMDSRKKEKKH
jgi:hypothetical protein